MGVKSAVREWSPAGKVVVVVALPLKGVTGSSRGMLASLNCTTPVTVAGVRVAVRVSVVIGSAEEAGVTSSVIVVLLGRAACTAWTVVLPGASGCAAVKRALVMSNVVPTVAASTTAPTVNHLENLFVRTM